MISDNFFMHTALELAKESNCVSFKVGAVIVKNKRIVSIGYNGTPAGFINCKDVFKDYDKSDPIQREKHHIWSKKHEIHAEMNALMFAINEHISIEGATLYVTHHPCDECLKNIVQTGIKKIVYKHDYDKRDKDNLFTKLIDIVQMSD